MKRWLLTIIGVMTGLALTAQAGRDYEVLFRAAMLQRQKQHYDACHDLLTRCLELRPDASESLFFLGLLYDMTGDGAEAMSCFRQAHEQEPRNTTYLEQLAASYIENDQIADAISAIEQLYDIDKSRTDLLDTLYRLYGQQQEFDKAIEVLTRMELIDGPSERTTLTKCRLYIEMGDNDRAVSEVRQLTQRYPNDLRYRTLYANTLMVTEHEDEAYAVLQQVFSEEPGNLSAQQVLRNYYLRQGNEEAADSVNHAILLNPDASVDDKAAQMRQLIVETAQQGGDSTVVLGLFDELLAQPEPSADLAEMKATYMLVLDMPADSVTAAFERVLLMAPDQASARLRLVQLAWDAQDDRRIISLCQAARQYNPEEMAFYYYQGMAYYRQDDYDRALEAFQTGISVINDESVPEIVSDFYAVMGDLLHLKGREQEAFAAYDSCLVWKADNVGALNNYAYYLSLRNERLDEAEHMSYRTVKAEPDNSTYLDTYAWILFMQKRYSEARIYIDQALQADSLVSGVIHEHAGDIYALCGDMDSAVHQWQLALADDPQNKLLRRKLKQKKYLKK